MQTRTGVRNPNGRKRSGIPQILDNYNLRDRPGLEEPILRVRCEVMIPVCERNDGAIYAPISTPH